MATAVIDWGKELSEDFGKDSGKDPGEPFGIDAPFQSTIELLCPLSM
jgi:hypothetical protein